MVMLNQSNCDIAPVDLSPSSTRLTEHPYLLVVIATVLCIMAVFIVGAHVVIIVSTVYERCIQRSMRRAEEPGTFGNTRKTLLISFSVIQLLIGGLFLPLAIVQVVNNGKWTLGPTLCSARILGESLSEVISIYHSICVCLDSFLMVSRPLKYRFMSLRIGYAMIIASWAIPIAIYIIATNHRWDTEGVEDVLWCTQESHLCSFIMGKKLVLLLLPSTVLISSLVFISMAETLLRKVHEIYQRRHKHYTFNDLNKISTQPDQFGAKTAQSQNTNIIYLTSGKIIYLTSGKIIYLTSGKIIYLTSGKIICLTSGKIIYLTSGKIIYLTSVVILVYSRYHDKHVNRTDQSRGISDNKRILTISFHELT
ncbi:hypothetical protein Btru_037187 [Bulinus truncatus]|nr:hypothetical protein Btru_037187 [Bulinus truncatus]